MFDEVKAATEFITNVLRLSNADRISNELLDFFDLSLQKLLVERYQNHWFPEKPFKGSGYRCMRINHNMEPILAKAAILSGVPSSCMDRLPNELTIWVDPQDVSCRFGENGSIGAVYSKGQKSESLSNTSSSPSPTYIQTCKGQAQHSSPSLNLRKFPAVIAS